MTDKITSLDEHRSEGDQFLSALRRGLAHPEEIEKWAQEHQRWVEACKIRDRPDGSTDGFISIGKHRILTRVIIHEGAARATVESYRPDFQYWKDVTGHQVIGPAQLATVVETKISIDQAGEEIKSFLPSPHGKPWTCSVHSASWTSWKRMPSPGKTKSESGERFNMPLMSGQKSGPFSRRDTRWKRKIP